MTSGTECCSAGILLDLFQPSARQQHCALTKLPAGAGSCYFPTDSCKFLIPKLVLMSVRDFCFEYSNTSDVNKARPLKAKATVPRPKPHSQGHPIMQRLAIKDEVVKFCFFSTLKSLMYET